MKVDITVYDKDGHASVILSTGEKEGLVKVHVCQGVDEQVSIEDLKTALRKLSAK
jgi:hypothetical protein